MQNLPLPKYTTREGTMNITSLLPDFFTCPDLGPKLYIAYGWATEKCWDVGTTNLHLDISDAINVMTYVGVPKDQTKCQKGNLKKIYEAGDVGDQERERISKNNLKPGALWHLWLPKDTDKLRQWMSEVRCCCGRCLFRTQLIVNKLKLLNLFD